MGINWQDIAAITVIFSAVLATAVVYLKLYVGNEIRHQTDSLKEDLVSKEIFELKIDSIYARIKRLEQQILRTMKGRKDKEEDKS